jgi:Zn-dependent membrane protease YugP
MAALIGILVLGVILLPQLWVRHTISRHGVERSDLQGTGGELARHLLNRFDLPNVKVEITDKGDHYDPQDKAVRLLKQHHDGRSLSAVAVAAHEVSHALQDAAGERKLSLRQELAQVAVWTDRAAGVFFIAAPFLAALARTPAALFLVIGIGVALLGVRVLVTLVTLPVEAGRYVDENDMPAIRSVLRAAALTYVAGALISLVNLARWVRLLR